MKKCEHKDYAIFPGARVIQCRSCGIKGQIAQNFEIRWSLK